MINKNILQLKYLYPLLFIYLSACDHQENSNIWNGYVEGDYIYISSPVSGYLNQINVQRGQQIKKGTELYRLDDAPLQYQVAQSTAELEAQQAASRNLKQGKRTQEVSILQAQLEQAKIQAQQAKLDFNRQQKLITSHAISKQEYDQAASKFASSKAHVAELQSQIDVAKLPARSNEIDQSEALIDANQAALGHAKWQLNQSKIFAQHDALVEDIFYRQGEWINAGKPILSLLPPENIKIRFYVPAHIFSQLKLGQKVKISCDTCTKPITANIQYLAKQAEYTPPVIYSRENSHDLVFMVEAKPDKESLKKLHVGLPISVKF